MDEAEAAALERLCERHGIARAYDDVFGHRRELPREALEALLRDAGLVPPEATLAEAEAQQARAAALRLLPLVQVVASGAESFVIALRLPPALRHFEWRLVDESGAVHEGKADAAALERLDAEAPPGALPAPPSGTSPSTSPSDAPARLHRALRVPLALPNGYHRFSIAGEPGETLLVCAPQRCHLPPTLDDHDHDHDHGDGDGDGGGGRPWGFTLQLHSLRSRRNWGIGDFGDLARFAERAAREGADVVGLNPLHALFPHNPAHRSPYSPSSRAHLNVLYIDVEAVPDLRDCAPARRRLRSPEFRQRLAALREAPLIDHPGVSAAKHEVLELLYRHFLARPHDDPEARALADFRRRGGEALRGHALFEALQAHLHARDPSIWGWPAWPENLRDPHGAAVAAFAASNAERIGYFEYLQFQAARQLEDAGARAKAAGMAVGLYLDLAVSVDGGGSDTWRQRDAYALGVRIGAPPDIFNPRGQDWGLPPLMPERLRERGHDVFIEALRANMRGAGAIRIDHVMMLMRLFWIPTKGQPADGSYVAYPAEELFAILTLESHRQRCMVIGEDLGTVPDALRAATRAHGVQSYRLLYFERADDGRFRDPAEYPHQAVVAVSTHDLPTLVGWWSAHDLRLRMGLGLIPDGAAFEQQLQERRRDRERLLDAVAAHRPLSDASHAEAAAGRLDAEVIAALHGFLAATPSGLMVVQLEDALAEVEQANLPGTVDEQPNWRRKYAFGLETLWSHPVLRQTLDEMTRTRPRPAPPDALPQGAPGGEGPAPQRTRIPRATYRLQLHSGFGFDDAARIVPYLQRLGISHVYCSPIQRARPGSMHGYDVVAHDEINPELGGAPAFERFSAVLKAHGMGQLIDLVPNHMGVSGNDNRWWLDVLENGRASRYARHFDIDWEPLTPGLAGKVLLPVLGEPYGAVLARGELALQWDPARGEFAVGYFEHRFPLSPESGAPILARAAGRLGDVQASVSVPVPGPGPGPVPVSVSAPNDARERLAALAAAFGRLPAMDSSSRRAAAERARDKELLKRRLAALAAESPAAAQAIEAEVAALNATDARAALHALLGAQAYRLAHWRVAADEINYRRFFDVNDLAALRTERRAVFEATHALALDLAGRGLVDGLRIDHPDGLQDPARYFERLQKGYAARAGCPPPGIDAEGRPERPLYVVAEKIAAAGEDVPVAWAVHGTTGYRFANVANAVLTDAESAGRIERIWREFTGVREPFAEIVYQAKREVARGPLTSDLEVLSIALLRIGKRHPATRDHSLNTLREVIATVAACLPVYRTYNGENASEQDRRYVRQAIAAARERLQLPEPSVFDFVHDALLGRAPGPGRKQHRRVLRFARRFQQYSAPVAAKGVEDTAFYRYFPLASANEVGGEPDRIGMTVAEFHEASADRCRRWPQTMLATSTHDNKRAEDVRLRLDVLSERPALWRLALGRWSRRHAALRGPVLPAHEYLLYQTLLGTLPLEWPHEQAREDYAARIVAYMLKAARESKTGTSWTHPEAGYEAALERFVRGLLADDPGNSGFRSDLQHVTAELDRCGALNGVSLAILKYASPGVPDLYQGCELIDRSLVDPDNRRPVDYDKRARLLDALEAVAAGGEVAQAVNGFASTPSDGRAKLWLIWRLLGLRRELPLLFRDGSYEPVEVRGPKAGHVIAFLRRHEGRKLLVIALRLFARLGDGSAHAGSAIGSVSAVSSVRAGGRSPVPDLPLGNTTWAGTQLLLPPGGGSARWTDRVTGTVHEGMQGELLELAPLLHAFPGAVLVSED